MDDAIGTFGNLLSDELSRIVDKDPKKAEGKQRQHLAKRLGMKPKFRDLPKDKVRR